MRLCVLEHWNTTRVAKYYLGIAIYWELDVSEVICGSKSRVVNDTMSFQILIAFRLWALDYTKFPRMKFLLDKPSTNCWLCGWKIIARFYMEISPFRHHNKHHVDQCGVCEIMSSNLQVSTLMLSELSREMNTEWYFGARMKASKKDYIPNQRYSRCTKNLELVWLIICFASNPIMELWLIAPMPCWLFIKIKDIGTEKKIPYMSVRY